MAHLIFNKNLLKYRKVVISYIASSDGRFHRKTFKDCTVIEAFNVFNVMSGVWKWYYCGYEIFEY